MSNKVVTRFAPSPTGNLHIGVARTALFNYLFAKQNKGKFLLRIEDTDKNRSQKEYEEDIISGLFWLGIKNDGPVYYQSNFENKFKKDILNKLIENGHAYYAEESKESPDKKVIRLKNPKEKVIFEDLIRGEIKIDTSDLEDFVIAKDIDNPLYHMAVVTDDIKMGITHIIRGEDLISSTPRQILIYRAIEKTIGKSYIPKYAHLPLILAPDRSKLSKRHGALSVNEYKKMGYLPNALTNFLALIGWNPGGNKEIFSMNELISDFSLKNINKGGAIFNIEKLNWINREYIKSLSEEDFIKVVSEYSGLKKPNNMTNKYIVNIIKERIDNISDIEKKIHRGEFDYIFFDPKHSKELLQNPKNKIDKDDVIKHLSYIVKKINGLDKISFDNEEVKNSVWNYATKEGRGNVLWPMRVALTGIEKSPDPFIVCAAIGKEKSIDRINRAIDCMRK